MTEKMKYPKDATDPLEPRSFGCSYKEGEGDVLRRRIVIRSLSYKEVCSYKLLQRRMCSYKLLLRSIRMCSYKLFLQRSLSGKEGIVIRCLKEVTAFLNSLFV